MLDEHMAAKWDDAVTRAKRKRQGRANAIIVRHADDFVLMVDGRREHVEDLHTEVVEVLAGIGLRLSEEKTSIVHIGQGSDFLGFRIQRRLNEARVSATSTRFRPG